LRMHLDGGASEEEDMEEEEEEEEEIDANFDFDALADKAVAAAEARHRVEPKELELDVGLSADDLYLTPSSGSSACFNTAFLPGVSTLKPTDIARGDVVLAPGSTKALGAREVRGAAVRPLDDIKERKAEAKKAREEKLDKWFGLRKRKLTPELEKELKAIKLRAYFDPKRFYKGNDSKELPKYFTVATEVGGGMQAVGENTRTKEVHAHSGRSFLSTVLRDDKAQEWTRQKYNEVGARHLASVTSGHGKRRGKNEKVSNSKRGGAWKKKPRKI